MTEDESQRNQQADWLAAGEKYLSDGHLETARVNYDLVLQQSTDFALRARAADGLADALLRGAGKEVVIRVLAWLTLAAGIFLAFAMIINGPKVEVPDAILGTHDQASPLALGLAAGITFSGIISCIMLNKFALLLERSVQAVALAAATNYYRRVGQAAALAARQQRAGSSTQ